MIRALRNNAISKVLWLVMSLYLLNISVDSADPAPPDVPEDLSLNDQESIVEIIVEEVLDYENAIEEYDDNETCDSKKKTVKIDLLARQIRASEYAHQKFPVKEKLFAHPDVMLANGFTEIDSPPPKV